MSLRRLTLLACCAVLASGSESYLKIKALDCEETPISAVMLIPEGGGNPAKTDPNGLTAILYTYQTKRPFKLKLVVQSPSDYVFSSPHDGAVPIDPDCSFTETNCFEKIFLAKK